MILAVADAAVPSLGAAAAPVALGMLALYFLLPRPRGYPAAVGLALGGAALVAGAVFLLPASDAPWVETLLFYSFGGLAVVSAAAMITQANPARAALAFAVVVLCTCGLFLLNAAPFLMAGTVIIYAGAVIVTFLFVIMLSQQDGPSNADSRSREPFLSVLAGGGLLLTLLLVVRQAIAGGAFPQAGPPLPAENVAALGRELYTKHLLGIELGGTLLLVATIGAIAITQRPRTDTAPARRPS